MQSNHIDRNQVSDNMYHTSKPLLPAVPLQLATLATRLQPHRFTIKKDLAYLALTNDRWSLKEGKCHWYYLGYECSMFHASSTDCLPIQFVNNMRSISSSTTTICAKYCSVLAYKEKMSWQLLHEWAKPFVCIRFSTVAPLLRFSDANKYVLRLRKIDSADQSWKSNREV